jgi:hypothetical protein
LSHTDCENKNSETLLRILPEQKNSGQDLGMLRVELEKHGERRMGGAVCHGLQKHLQQMQLTERLGLPLQLHCNLRADTFGGERKGLVVALLEYQ